MKKEIVQKKKNRDSEKGAAMVMVLLLSTLLLVASAGIILETSMNTANVTDATAEQQAYNAAESGLQSAINVLRGNSEYQKTTGDKIDFRKAVNLSTSNAVGDSSTKGRLSRWMNYSSTHPDRIILGLDDPTKYNPLTGYAYSVTVTDPDYTGKIISFETSGGIYGSDNKWQSPAVFGVGVNTVTISYTPNAPVKNLDVSSGSKDTSIGSFTIATSGSVTFTEDIRFRIIIDMTAPYTATRVIRGWIKVKGKTITSTSTIDFDFDSSAFVLMGSNITVKNLNSDNILTVSAVSTTTISVNMTQAEPYRVVVRSVGYGPRGARKELEATVQKNFFNGLSAPATLTLVGSTSGFTFNPGPSNEVSYSGDDIVSNINIPSIGTTNEENLTTITTQLGAQEIKTVPDPPAENVNVEIPYWLQSPTRLHSTIESLRTVAKSSGRYWANGQQPAYGDAGDSVTGTGITFVDGDMELSQQGGGILVCTGKLTFHGNFTFRGLIIVTGAEGIVRSGGGNGILQGNTVIAPYDPNNLGAGFLAPKYNLSGGGTSTIQYNSDSVNNGMTAVSNFVLAVAEK